MIFFNSNVLRFSLFRSGWVYEMSL